MKDNSSFPIRWPNIPFVVQMGVMLEFHRANYIRHPQNSSDPEPIVGCVARLFWYMKDRHLKLCYGHA